MSNEGTPGRPDDGAVTPPEPGIAPATQAAIDQEKEYAARLLRDAQTGAQATDFEAQHNRAFAEDIAERERKRWDAEQTNRKQVEDAKRPPTDFTPSNNNPDAG